MTTEATTTANGAEPAPAASPGSDLNALIDQFEKGTKEPAPNPNAVLATVLRKIEPVVEHVAREAEIKTAEAYNRDLTSTIEAVKAGVELPKEFPDEFVRGYLIDYANAHPEFNDAWTKRQAAPDAWIVQRDVAQKSLKGVVEKLPKSDGSDVKRAKASVQGLSTQPSNSKLPTPVEMVNMSDRAWRQFLESQA